MDDHLKTIVIDAGSGSMKAGFAGNEFPLSVFPSIIGSIRQDVKYVGNKNLNIYIGNEACAKAGILNLKYPIEHGIVTNWDDMEKLFNHVFNNELFHENPEEHPVLLTEASRNPNNNREKLIQLMFESFNIPSFYICPQCVLALYASGCTTGIVCEIGDGVTQVVPFFNQCIFNKAVSRFNFGGKDITSYLQLLLSEKGYKISTTAENEVVIRQIKEKYCDVVDDYDAEIQKFKSNKEKDIKKSFLAPWGEEIIITDESFRCSELLFKPYLHGFEFDGISKIIFDSIMKCNIGARKDLYSNIILAGGSTKFNGLKYRIEDEISKLSPQNARIRVKAEIERNYYDWLGGSIFGSMDGFLQKAISHDE